MIRLVKYQRNGSEVLLAKSAQIEVFKTGVAIGFPSKDGRKASYSIAIDEESIINLVDELLDVLNE